MSPDSRDPFAGPSEAERRGRGRRWVAVGSAILAGLLVALLLLAVLQQAL